MNIKHIIRRILYSNNLLYNMYDVYRNRSRVHGITIINKGCARLQKKIVGENNRIEISKGAVLNKTTIVINGNNNSVYFDENCSIGKDCSFWIEGNDVKIHIHKNTTFTHSVHFCAQENNTQIIVGDDCMFSNNIVVRTSDSHPIYNAVTNKRINNPSSVIIGRHVWVAPNSKIFKGVNIGQGSIIGSDTIVTRDIPENVLAVGHPAKVIKTNIKWTREMLFPQ